MIRIQLMNQQHVSDLITLTGAAFGVSFSLLLYLSKQNHGAKRYLSLLLLLTGMSIIMQYLSNQELNVKHPHLIRVHYPVNFLFGPLLYLFTCELTESGRKHSGRWLHLLPFLLITLTMIFFYYRLDEATKLMIHRGGGDEYFIRHFFRLCQMLIIPHGLIYMVFSLIRSRSYQKRINQYFSRIDEINLKWLNRIIIIILLSWIISGFSMISRALHVQTFHFAYINGIVGTSLIYVLAYLMMRQPDLFKYISLVDELTQAPESSPEKTRKYKNLSMDEETQKESYRRLIATLEKNGKYLDPDLTVKELAESMGITSAQLSMVISSQSDHNFYSLVNTFRVEEAKALLASKEYVNRNILDVAYASGFNSKSVFNSYFKKISGITPLQYKKAHSAAIGRES